MGIPANPQQPGQALADHLYIVPVTLTAGTLATVTTTPAISIGSMPFLWEAIGAEWNTTNGQWFIRIRDASQDKSFMPARISVDAWIGDDKQPIDLKYPWLFGANSAIIVEAYNAGTGTDTLYLVFIGKRLTP